MPSFATEATLKRIEGYLNNLQTFEADFEQYAPGTPYSTGTFYLQRPKKFLWQYKVPHQQKIVSTGGRMFFHDPKTEQTTQLPLNSGLAAVLTKQPFYFQSDDIAVQEIRESEDIIAIELTLNNKNEDGAAFTLKFTKEPFALLSLNNKDKFGQGVSISFKNIQQGHELKDELFEFVPAVEMF